MRPCTACNTTTTWGWDVYANDVGPQGLDNIKAFILNYDAERRISSRRKVLAAGFSDIEFLSTLSYHVSQEQNTAAETCMFLPHVLDYRNTLTRALQEEEHEWVAIKVYYQA